MDRHQHWENVYRTRAVSEVSWYAAHLDDSLRLIREVATLDSAIIDVGAGASTLADDLLAGGYRKLSLLDISESALAVTRARIGAAADALRFLCGDITQMALPEEAYDVWHDRAVFHFLTEEADRRAYSAALQRSLVGGGHVIIGTFSLAGPMKCSGLPVVRYDAPALQRALGDGFDLETSLETIHLTPGGNAQHFVLCRFRKSSR